MAYLKAAGKALINSPKAIRKKFGASQEDVRKHEQLEEDWYHSDDPINAGISFYVKYLGSAPVTKTHGPGSTDDAVRAIVLHAKQRGGKLQKVSITVSSKFIKIQDIAKQLKLEDLPLYRVSYCTVDPYYDKVFCYISRNPENKKLDCHAFLCSKKAKAEAITLTVAQAFNIAYEKWQVHKKKKDGRTSQPKQHPKTEPVARDNILIGTELTTSGEGSLPKPNPTVQAPTVQAPPVQAPKVQAPAQAPTVQAPPVQAPKVQAPAQAPTVQAPPVQDTAQQFSQINIGVTPAESPRPVSNNPFMDDTHLPSTNSGLLSVKPTMTKAISLDYLHMDDEFDVEFTQLAEARSNPHLLDIGEHINRATSQEEVKEMMKEGDKSTVEDLSRSKSIDDLLMI